MRSASLLLLGLGTALAFAHSGDTDARGGHFNRKTGEYHFHHGMSAHQHPSGVCPYGLSPAKPKESPPRPRSQHESTSLPQTVSSFEKPLLPPPDKSRMPTSVVTNAQPRAVSEPPGAAKIGVEDDATIRSQLQHAEKGFAPAQYAVGLRYLSGIGLPVDKAKAKELLTSAAIQGHQKAKERLREIQELEGR